MNRTKEGYQCKREKEDRRHQTGKQRAHGNRAEQQDRGVQKNMKPRLLMEYKLSGLKIYNGLRKARYRGLKKVNLQCYFAAVAVSIKR
jgi:IS5 family transposase